MTWRAMSTELDAPAELGKKVLLYLSSSLTKMLALPANSSRFFKGHPRISLENLCLCAISLGGKREEGEGDTKPIFLLDKIQTEARNG